MKIWLLTHLPRPIVVSVSSVLTMILLGLFAIVGISIFIGGLIGLASLSVWGLLLLGFNLDINGLILIDPSHSLLGVCDIIVGLTWFAGSIYKEIDSDFPKREK